MRRKKILFLTPMNPFLSNVSGGLLKTRKLLNYLSSKHDVTLFYLDKEGGRVNDISRDATLSIKSFLLPDGRNERSLRNLGLSFFYGKPLTIFRNYGADIINSIINSEEEFDVIFVDHYLMYQYVPDNAKSKVILHQHNAEFLMWERVARFENNIIKKIVMKLESKRIKSYEANICSKADYVLASPNDISELINVGVSKNKFVVTYHLGDDGLLVSPSLTFDEENVELVFLGTLSWEANRDGLIWFIQKVLPFILINNSNVKLNVIGKADKELVENFSSRNVVFHGFVDDLEKVMGKGKVFVSPLRYGSGMKVKVITAMYRGLPIVTTSVGAEGIELVDGSNAFISDDAESFAKSVVRLISDKLTWDLFSTNSRKLAKENYSWERVFKNVEDVIND